MEVRERIRREPRALSSNINGQSLPNTKQVESEDVNYEFGKEKQSPKTTISTSSLFGFITSFDRQCLLYLTIAAIIVRLAFLNHPSVVVFDEVHFGGFAQKYLKGEFFFDLHPPLARLLVTLSAWFAGWDASFSFYDIGADYIKPGVPYVMMRGFCALAGVAVIPIAFITLRAMEVTAITALTTAAALIFENALMTQSRLILLDAYLILFTTLVGLFWALFRRQRHRPFSREWKLSLVGLGVSMTLAASCKWVGLFAVAAMGLYTMVDLWRLLGDRNNTISILGQHLWARFLALVMVPLLIYGALFQVQFVLLKTFTPGAGGMSLEFQQTLQGGELEPTMEPIYYGAQVRIRQYLPEGPFLHSHGHYFSTGSKQQQVTGYHHRDGNNFWIIRRAFIPDISYTEQEGPDERTELVSLRHGDQLRLEHMSTGRFLHSHPVAPPLSNKEKQNEVSAYAHHPTKFSDLNDNWIIELVDEQGNSITKELEEAEEIAVENLPLDKRPPVLALCTKFRLRHKLQYCYLHTRNKKLPEWGFGQAEITCGKETLRSHQIWIIEANTHPAVDENTVKKATLPKASFWTRFVEMNRKMWSTNAGLSSEHPFGSRPESWPLLARGVGFWNGNHVPRTEHQFKVAKKAEGRLVTEDDEEELEAASEEEGEEAEEGIDAEELERRQQERQAQREQRAAEREVRKQQKMMQKKEDEEIDEAEKNERIRLAQEYEKFKGQQIYLLGNPTIWWSAVGAIGLYVLLTALAKSLRRRPSLSPYFGPTSILGSQLDVMSNGAFLFIQWLWHYIPFFGMRRQLFLHHYLPALYFSVLLLGLLLDVLLRAGFAALGWESSANDKDKNKNNGGRAERIRMSIHGLFLVITIYTFWRLAPLGYGLRLSKSQCEALKWRTLWDFDCSSLVDPVTTAIVTTGGLP